MTNLLQVPDLTRGPPKCASVTIGSTDISNDKNKFHDTGLDRGTRMNDVGRLDLASHGRGWWGGGMA